MLLAELRELGGMDADADADGGGLGIATTSGLGDSSTTGSSMGADCDGGAAPAWPT